MEWPVLPYTMIPFRIPPPLILHPPPRDDDLPMDLSIGKNKHPVLTPPLTPDTPISSSSGCQSPRFESLMGMSHHHFTVGDPGGGVGVPPSRELERTYECLDCSYTTRRRTNLKRHIQSMHSRQETVECCGNTFNSKAEFRAHVRQSHQNGYKCHLCDRSFCRKALLKRHMSVHNGIKEFDCSLCQYATSHKSNLERHQRVHNRQNNLLFHQQPDRDGVTSTYPLSPDAKLQHPPLSPSASAPRMAPFSPSQMSRSSSQMSLSPSQMSRSSSQMSLSPSQLSRSPSQMSLCSSRMSLTSDVTEESSAVEDLSTTPEDILTPPDETTDDTLMAETPIDDNRRENQEEENPNTRNDRLMALRVATEEVLAMQETSKMMAGSQRLYTWPYKCVQCMQKFKTQQALTLHEIQIHPNRRADAFLSFPLKYQLKVVYNAIASQNEAQAREHSKED